MKRYGIAILLAGACTLAACGSKTSVDNTTVVTTGNDTVIAQVSGGQLFANTAASSDAFEIAMSQLAATNAKSPKIKAFATQMIKAHTESTGKLQTAAAAASPAIIPDSMLTAEQQGKVDALKALNGADFDTAFASAQVDAHQMTLDGLKDYVANGDVPTLKAFAAELVPTVTAHLNMAKGLKP